MSSDKPPSSSSKLHHRSSVIGSGLHSTSSIASLRPSSQQPHASPSSASVDRTSAFAEAGEVQSGRALSVGRRARDDWIVSGQEKALNADPKFRKYATLVERTLLSIDQVNEWADFITFLAKLLKTLQSHPHYPIIPHKLTVAKRLSQCLNPALPQGVHQRALDVYVYILTTIGADGLRRDLQVWSTGLFPFFQYAATAVRPIVLGLFEKFYLPLKADLRPAMKAFILALLPGLEEETGEHFDRVCSLLDQLSGAVSLSFFLQNLWLVLITGPGYRISAINFLSRRMPQLETATHITSVVGEDVGLMVRGYSAALEDGNILVQRGVLDLILTHFKLNSPGFSSDTRKLDQLLLTRAALGVVLRRDLSLSRRLYTWLLGPLPPPEDQSNHHSTYFRDHGLRLVTQSLREDMKTDEINILVERQRPFKIFIALLDKWEIGGPLTQALVLDAFRALKEILSSHDTQDELLLTANMMFDSLDPFTTWKRLFQCVSQFVMHKGDEHDSLALVNFIVTTFKINDEELLRIHIPLLAFALIDMVDRSTNPPTDSSYFQIPIEALRVTAALIKEFPDQLFENESTTKSLTPQSSLDLAYQFYEAESLKHVDPDDLLRLGDLGILTESLSAILRVVRKVAATPSWDLDAQFLSAALEVLHNLIGSIPSLVGQIQVDWCPRSWTEPLLARLDAILPNATGFALIEQVVRVMLDLAGRNNITPPLLFDNQATFTALIVKLLEFLQGKAAPFFLSTVKLIWDLQNLSKLYHVETIIASRLSSSNYLVREAAFEAFGNLWRYTEDTQLPGARLRLPLFLVLNSLKSDNLTTRRCGEAWMRCSLKSYLRVLDPLFRVLLSTEIKRKPFGLQLRDLSLPVHHYVYPFDQALVQHSFECLLTLARFGGQGFTRIAKTCFLKHSHDPALRQLSQRAELDSASYLDALVKIILLFINSDPQPALSPAMFAQNQIIHATAADLLQMIVSRGDLTSTDLAVIESALSHRLLISIRTSEYSLQNKLLHALHATIGAGSSSASHSRRSMSQDMSIVKDRSDVPNPTDAKLFALVVGDGITTQKNTAVVHHWIDFLLMTVPQFRRSFDEVVNPLIDRLVGKLRSLISDLELTYHAVNQAMPSASDVTDSEFSVFVNALERLMVVLIEGGGATSNSGEGSGPKGHNERSNTSDNSGGLFAGVFGVLGSSESAPNPLQDRPKTDFQRRLGQVISVLINAWDISQQINDVNELESSNSQAYYSARVKVRSRKAFERIYKAIPSELVEGIIDYWQTEIPAHPLNAHPTMTEDNIFQLLDHLAPSAQTIVTMLFDRLSALGHLATTEKGKAMAAVSFLPEGTLFSFLESYLLRLEGPIAVQIWGSCLNFARDVLGNLTSAKTQVFPTLKWFTVLAEKISQTSALEDRRMRRDLQETFVKLCDSSIQGAGKYLEQQKSKPDSNGDTVTIMLEKDQPLSPLPTSSLSLEDKKVYDTDKSAIGNEVAVFLAEKALPGCRRFLIEADKLYSVCVNIMYYIVAPSFKSRARSIETDGSILDLLVEMTKHSGAIKAWRAQVVDTFGDARFFSCSPEFGRRWKPIIQALLNTDKERFTEMLSRLSTVPSANIFTNKEAEMIMRSLSLRRITYLIYAADYNRFLVHLPSIQEKVVDLLRSNVGDIVHAEVYLCMRVLLCRIANQHLSGFWPVILTELTRFFEGIIEHMPDSPHTLALALSASKFLDLLLVLKTEDFQIHQWIFITDTVDAMYPPDSWFPHALIDRLAETLRERVGNPLATRRKSSPTVPLQDSPPVVRLVTPVLSRAPSLLSIGPNHSSQNHSQSPQLTNSTLGRRPLLSQTRKIETMRPLERFFSKVSLMNYEACYLGGVVDWDTVELDLESDIFEERD